MEEKLEELRSQIRQWAEENGNTVSYTMIADIFKEECADMDEQALEKILYDLTADGINIEPFERDESYEADAEEPEKFIPADVNIAQRPLNVYNLMERLEYGEIDLQPDFQRHGGLWTDAQQSQLIESLMLKIPLPAFYFNATDEKNWVVIDGLQRLIAFKKYLVGEEKEDGKKEKRKFVKLQYLPEFNGRTFDDLPRQYIRRIKESPIIAYAVERGTPDEVVFNIFQRINTGGLKLESQEIRHALYPGPATNLTVKLAKSREFIEATQHAVKPDRMLDREYITRFIAFTELDFRKDYKGNIDNFLIKGLKRANTYEEKELRRIEQNFNRIMRYVKDIFGKFAFRKYNADWRRGPINKALFELWAICFYNVPDEDMEQIVRRRQEFLRGFQIMFQNSEFTSALRSGDPSAFEKRVNMTQNFIKEFLC